MKHAKLLAGASLLIAISATAWAATPAAPATPDMQTMMQGMRTRIQQIASTTDGAERQKLADRFMQDMPAQCGAMMGSGHGMMGHGTTPGAMMGNGMMQAPAAK